MGEQRIVLTAPISRTPRIQGYGAREAFLEISLLLAQMRRRLLVKNDEHGNKVLRKEILDTFGEIERFSVSRLQRAGVEFDASDFDAGQPSEQAGRQV